MNSIKAKTSDSQKGKKDKKKTRVQLKKVIFLLFRNYVNTFKRKEFTIEIENNQKTMKEIITIPIFVKETLKSLGKER